MKAGHSPIPDSLQVACDPHSPGFYSNPYREYARWHKEHPVFYWKDYGLWSFTGFADVNRILRDPRFGRQILHRYTREQLELPAPKAHLKDFHSLEQHSLLNLEAPAHTRLRKFVNHAFTHRRVQSLLGEIEDLAAELIEKMVCSPAPVAGVNVDKTTNAQSSAAASDASNRNQKPAVDLLENYAAPLAAGVIAKLVGAPASAIPALLGWSHALVRVYTLTQTHEEEIAANLAAKEFRAFLLELIHQRRTSPGTDLLSSLVQIGAIDAPTDDEIVSVIVLLLNAGHEATVHQIGNAVRLMLRECEDPASYFSDESAARNTVSELMRLDTPLHLFTRYALEKVAVQVNSDFCLELEPGDEIALLLGAANHDPLVFE